MRESFYFFCLLYFNNNNMKEKREIIKKPTIHNNFKYDIKKIKIVSYLFVSFFFA